MISPKHIKKEFIRFHFSLSILSISLLCPGVYHKFITSVLGVLIRSLPFVLSKQLYDTYCFDFQVIFHYISYSRINGLSKYVKGPEARRIELPKNLYM